MLNGRLKFRVAIKRADNGASQDDGWPMAAPTCSKPKTEFRVGAQASEILLHHNAGAGRIAIREDSKSGALATLYDDIIA